MKKSKIHPIFLYGLLGLVIALALESCKPIATAAYGFKLTVEDHSEADIQNKAEKWGIKPDESYLLQDSYKDYLDSLGLIYNLTWRTCGDDDLLKNHAQPLQIMFFDSNDKLVSYNVNCYAGGFPNLRWNRNHELDTLPAKQVIPPDTLINFKSLIRFTNNIDGQKPSVTEFTNNEYNIVVFWTTFMGRQARRLIRIIHNKYGKYKENVSMIFINANPIWLDE